MDRFEYADAQFMQGEHYIVREWNTRLYDGEEKTSFSGGELFLTTHRVLWGRPGEIPRGLTCLSLPMRYVVFVEEETPATSFGFHKNRRVVVLHLTEALPGRIPGPFERSRYHYIKIVFKDGMQNNLTEKLLDAIHNKKWEDISARPITNIKLRTGIVGIERGIQEKQKATNESISEAFQDLSKLMSMAKDMVQVSKNISQKIRDSQGDITDDVTVRFKSYLMSLGIDDPVTRQECRTESEYYKQLAKQLAEILEQPITEVGGMMALTDVYCRVNRARGLELLSPEDLIQACHMLNQLKLPIRLREFDSGVKVLQLQTHDDANVVRSTVDALEHQGSLTAEKLAQSIGISVLLAKERLLTTEKHGKACRDESIEGLRFYPNLFLRGKAPEMKDPAV